MNIIHTRAVLVIWLLLAAACVAWPYQYGWAGWPSEAQTYARWATYKYDQFRLVHATTTTTVSGIFLLLGAALLFCRITLGRFIFLVGFILQAYSKYTYIPVIAESAELGLYAAYCGTSGYVLAVSFSNISKTNSKLKGSSANDQIG